MIQKLIRETYTSTGLTFTLEARLTDTPKEWYLAIQWANGEDALDGYGITITHEDAERLAELFTIEAVTE